MSESAASHSERGAVLVESAFCLGSFLFLLLAASDLMRVSYVYLAMQHSVQRTISWAALNSTPPGPNRVKLIEDELISIASGFGIALVRENIWVCPSDEPQHCASEDAGIPRRYFQIAVRYPTLLVVSRSVVNLQFQAVGRNERVV